MNQALVQDVVAEVMQRLGDRSFRPASRPTGVRAGEDAPANDAGLREKHSISVPVGQHGVFADVDQAVGAATEAQKKLVKLSLDERDQIVKMVKAIAKQNAQSWGKIELDETKIGRLDH